MSPRSGCADCARTGRRHEECGGAGAPVSALLPISVARTLRREFVCLLADDLADRPHDLSRDLDVIRSGIRARLSCCGIADGPIKNSTGLTTTILAALLIIVLGATSIWTQLADGSLHHTPDTYTARLAFTVLTTTGAFVAAAAVGAGFVVLRGVITAVRAGRGRQLDCPRACFSLPSVCSLPGR